MKLLPLFDPKLFLIYVFLFIFAVLYSYVWHRLYQRSTQSNLLIDTSFLKAIHYPMYGLFILYAIRATIPYIPEWFLIEFELTEQSFVPVFPVGFMILTLWAFNQFLSNIQDRIIAIEKNEPVPNGGAWISACKLGRVVSIMVFALTVLYYFKIPTGQFMAPAAISALALSFASQDVLSNVFGGLVVLCDRPFSVGDFVRIASYEEGTVRYIGWRMTEIQLRNGRILHVPNGLITKSVVTNYTEKTHWFVQKEFGVRYEDFAKSPKIAEALTEWIKNHPYANHRRSSFARVFELEDSSVTIRVRVYLKSSIKTEQWYEFVQDLLLAINDTVKKHKGDFAFPTRTVLLEDKKGKK